MKRTLTIGGMLLAVVGIAALAGSTTTASAKPQQSKSLVGTGATFPFPLISKWIPAVSSSIGLNLTYTATGSGAGIAQITARTVDFGASDAPLTSDQLTACRGCVVIPWALAGMSVMYNLPGVSKRLILNGPVLANIYLGNIATWNAAAIRALNPGVTLPATKITPAYRSDGSGSTYAYTDYLSAVSPQWRNRVGKGTSVNFPAGVGARGSAGVAGVVKSTEGALGYADAAYAITNKIQFALVKNRAGGNATPGIRGVTNALCEVPAKVTNLAQLKIVDPSAKCGKKAYPISTFTYVIVPTDSGDKAATLRQFVYWAVTAGQRFGPPLFFVPLPKAVNAFIYREIKKIQS